MGAMRWVLALLATTAFGQTERVVESIVPAMAYGPECSSAVELRNLSDRAASVDVEGHRGSGALVSLANHPDMAIVLGPHESGTYKLEIEEETTEAWVKVREHAPAGGSWPVIAVSGSTECVAADQLRTVTREVVFPTRNPWFSSAVDNLREGQILLINTSEQAATASACYSSGNLYSRPDAGHGGGLQPICSAAFAVRVPPFGSRVFPVSREGSSYFELKTAGEAIVLQMLRPLGSNVRVYKVDSSIRFGEEVRP
jgi:hypothetical protein